MLGTSPKTSLAGIAQGLVGAIFAIWALYEAVKTGTVTEATLTAGVIGVLSILSAVKGLAARDNHITSEVAKAKGRLP